MRVAVTGAGGFLGRALQARLAGTATVLPLEGDIREAATFARAEPVDVVYHLAAQSSIPESARDPATAWAVNVDGTRNVLQWAHRGGARRVVLLSSAHVYGRPVRSPLGEDHPLAPVSAYGATKLAAEAVGRLFAAQGLEVVIVRPFNIYGPGQAAGFLVPDILAQLRQGTALVLGDPAPVRDYTYLDDAIDFLVRTGSSPGISGRALNLGSGQGSSVAQVVQAALGAAGSALRPVHEAARFRPNEVAEMVADAGLAQRLLGWRATTTLGEGLRRTWSLDADASMLPRDAPATRQ